MFSSKDWVGSSHFFLLMEGEISANSLLVANTQFPPHAISEGPLYPQRQHFGEINGLQQEEENQESYVADRRAFHQQEI